MLTGDTVLGRGTTVVAHPDGRLAPYLDSLRRLRDWAPGPCCRGTGRSCPTSPRSPTRTWPTGRSGWSRSGPRSTARARRRRAPDVVRLVYADVDPVLWPAAELSVRAQLEYLRR